jgi:hypothetical protein
MGIWSRTPAEVALARGQAEQQRLGDAATARRAAQTRADNAQADKEIAAASAALHSRNTW